MPIDKPKRLGNNTIMTFGKQLNKTAKKDFFETPEDFDKLMQELELKRIRKSMSIKNAVKNRI